MKGLTGLAATVCAIVTLFALMQLNAPVNWREVFAAKAADKSGNRVMQT